jgi:type IV secretory pathway TrbL component
LSHFLIRVSFWPIFSALAIRARLVVLNPGPAFVLPVIEPFAVEAQIMVFVAHHFVLFHVSLFNYRTPLFFQERRFVVVCPLLFSLLYLCMIHGVGSGIPKKSCAPV